MLTVAQCEKAVTILGLIRYARTVFKATLDLSASVPAGRPLSKGRIPALFETLAATLSCLVINDLWAGMNSNWIRFKSPLQYLQNRAFVLLRGEWFGPSFVSIMPTGVRVCSF